MAGIYIHVPFCKTRCIYCDFYSTTHTGWSNRYIDALCKELEMRSGYLPAEPVRTVYFGGGTPSQLSAVQLSRVFRTIERVYGLKECVEITLEANPDDLTDAYLSQIGGLPFNRISMGIQTFKDETLKLLRRRHTARQAVEAVGRCRKAGFSNISIDLIYGLPGETEDDWLHDLKTAVSLNPEHISAYHLAYEEGTAIDRMRLEHQLEEVDEESSVCFFTKLAEVLQQAGYIQYEISNFCRPGYYSRHNSSYWRSIPYLGCGPSAHSYNGSTEREWNVASLDLYIKGIETGHRCFETEHLDRHTRYNDFIITRLRTMWGMALDEMKQRFGDDLHDYCLRMARPSLEAGHMEITDGGILRLTRKGLFISDDIMSDLLWVD